MGGERASKTRQREAGILCALCDQHIRTPPPARTPGTWRRERLCLRCTLAKPHPVRCHILTGVYVSVTFLEMDLRTPVGPWLLFDTVDELRAKLFARGKVTEADARATDKDTHRWGVSTVTLHLTTGQYLTLKQRRTGWPWNGYELAQMKRSGTYPPRRLTAAEEEAFLRDRKK
jgi:hypothetical protein